MRLSVLLKHLESQGVGRIGDTLFQHSMPADVTHGAFLRLPLIGVAINEELPGYFKSTLQAIVRSPRTEDAESLADMMSRALTMRDVILNGENGYNIKINHILPKTKPIIYPRSEGNEIEVSLNFATSYVEY